MKKFLIAVSSVTFLLVSNGMLTTSANAKTLPTGVYSGEFGDGKATLFIDSVNKSRVKGRSLYRHNDRPFTGSIKAQGNFWHLTLNEPGNRTGDGQFDIMTLKDKPTIFIGKWHVFKANNTRIGIADKNFSLSEKNCKYNKYAGDTSEGSTRILSDEDLFQDPESLNFMINEIYARHGYSFKSKKWASEFAEADWYVPCYTDVSGKLTDIEKKNIKRLKEMSKYLEENPGEWGR